MTTRNLDRLYLSACLAVLIGALVWIVQHRAIVE